MEFDGAAALRCWSIDVDLELPDGSRTFTIPPLTADRWLVVMASGTWADIVPGLLDDADDLDDLIAEGELDTGMTRAAARDALAEAAGCKWWIAQGLAGAALGSWVGHDLVIAGVDPTRVSLGAYLAAAFRAATANMTKEQRTQFEMKLEQPPAGVRPEEWYDPDEAASAFMALMNSGG